MFDLRAASEKHQSHSFDTQKDPPTHTDILTHTPASRVCSWGQPPLIQTHTHTHTLLRSYVRGRGHIGPNHWPAGGGGTGPLPALDQPAWLSRGSMVGQHRSSLHSSTQSSPVEVEMHVGAASPPEGKCCSWAPARHYIQLSRAPQPRPQQHANNAVCIPLSRGTDESWRPPPALHVSARTLFCAHTDQLRLMCE